MSRYMSDKERKTEKNETFPEPDRVFIIFKTHLDMGFTDLAANVLKQYFEDFIPKAIRTANQLKSESGEARFIWTLGSWIIWHYLEIASGKALSDIERALAEGDIVWHGLPFTTHTELLTPDLIRYGLSISRKLDERFDKKTIGAKMTDVPGHTIGMVPFLAEAGIQMLHIGVNNASTPPGVPESFIWRHQNGAEVIVVYDKKGYGGQTILGDSLFMFAHTLDNIGPQSPEGVRIAFEKARKKFNPDSVKAANLNDFAAAAVARKEKLPVVREEIGDTWIHGTETDPWKTTRMRALLRLIEGGKEPVLEKVRDNLICVAEHTWGMDEKTHLRNYWHYSKEGLTELRKKEKCRKFETSWMEQRGYIEDSVKILGNTPLAEKTTSAIKELEPVLFDTRDFKKLKPAGISTRHFDIEIDTVNGSICYLRHRKTGRVWCSGSNRIGLFMYENFSSGDYRRFFRQFIKNFGNNFYWSIDDYSKPGMGRLGLKHKRCFPHVAGIYSKDDSIITEIEMPYYAVKRLGAPGMLQILYNFPDEKPELEITLQWFNKSACRIAEASWFTFQFDRTASVCWYMDKLGTRVSPKDVVSKGNRSLSAISKGVYYDSNEEGIIIESPDAHLVAFDSPSLLDFHNLIPDAGKGLHFNLHNNIWGTNFPMWFEDDCKFRFRIELQERLE